MTTKRDLRPSPKQEALETLDKALKMVTGPTTLTGFDLATLRGAIEYATGRVEQIQEVKRARKDTKGDRT